MLIIERGNAQRGPIELNFLVETLEKIQSASRFTLYGVSKELPRLFGISSNQNFLKTVMTMLNSKIINSANFQPRPINGLLKYVCSESSTLFIGMRKCVNLI